MTVKLNRLSYEHAQKLIKDRQCVFDDRDQWHDHRPSRGAEKRIIERQGLAEYVKWHLGEDGDFQNVHRCAVLATESRAGRYEYADIEMAPARGTDSGFERVMEAAGQSDIGQHTS
jgi:hypothetical protein